MTPHRARRKPFVLLVLAAACCQTACTTDLFRLQSPDSGASTPEVDDVQYVDDLMRPAGLNFLKLEGIAMVNGLPGTGSDPTPTRQRDQLINEMETFDIKSPVKLLASSQTSLVLVRALIPPGAQKGDRFDVQVRTPRRTETTSLKGGWLMPVRMRRTEILGGTVRTGDVAGEANGDVIVETIFEGDDAVLATRGRVLDGGEVRKSRPIGLGVRRDSMSIRTTTMCTAAVNDRFVTYGRGGVKRGAAVAKNDKYVELTIPRQYRHNVVRYIRVVRNLAVGESQGERMSRMRILEQQLLDPATASLAALRLEAIGKGAVGVLQTGLASDDPAVRFYAAEALAYIDVVDAAAPLAETARREAAFRWHALTALSSMSDLEAGEALESLLHEDSAETRYGAFRALWTRSPDDPVVAETNDGKHFPGRFHYHRVGTTGEPMIHFSRTRRRELVLFGPDQRMESPGVISAGETIMVRGVGPDRIKVLRFAPGQDTRHVYCSTRVDDVIRSIVEMGGGYAEVLAALQEARDKGHLKTRLAIEALPTSGRTYRPDEEDAGRQPSSPLPELFNGGGSDNSDWEPRRRERASQDDDDSGGGILGRLNGWFTGDGE